MSVCRCEGFVHPRHIHNPPNLSSIDYRVGAFLEFRHALLLSRPGEQRLAQWNPGGEGDLAVQLVEWWAYLADVLTFYNERTARQSYLRTADDEEAVRNLVRILGYRPRPGLAAHALLGAVLSAREATLPRGLQFESKPPPGKKPQTFELDADTKIALPDVVTASLAPDDRLFALDSLLLRGTGATIDVGDRLLLVKRNWDGTANQARFVTVDELQEMTAPDGSKNLLVDVTGASGMEPDKKATEYQLLRSTQSARPRRGTDTAALNATSVHLDALYRDITPLTPLVLRSGSDAKVVLVTSVTETVYYANGPESNPLDPPAAANTPAIGMPATRVFYANTPGLGTAASTTVLFRWTPVGELIPAPAAASAKNATEIEVTMTPRQMEAFLTPRDVLVEDETGNGTEARVTRSSSKKATLSDFSQSALPLTAPLDLLLNVLKVSRGKSVPREVLGSGDATRAGQDFVLRNTPVTYLQDSASRSGENYSSTVRIWVNGVEWHEVQSFYGQPSTAHVFVTYEDAEGKTHVTTGDGINGARLPSGVDNIVASYRYGSGEEAPAAGTLTVVTKSYPGLRSVRNPVAAGGGADPDAASRLRELAPRSVLTFGRAVSAADYEAIALSSPGVDRVRAYWSFNADEQRAMLTLYVGDEESSADAARTAILGAGESDDAVVLAATRIELEVFMTVVHDPDHDAETVKAAVSAVIFDPVDGVFGSRKSRIGRAVYRSAIHAACLAVPGVVALRELYVLRDNVNWGIWNLIYSLSHRYAPGEGGYFVVNEVTVTMETPDGQ